MNATARRLPLIILIVLNAIGLGPQAAAGVALVAGIDRPLDMCRTTVNTLGNLVGAAWIGRSERAGAAQGESDGQGVGEETGAMPAGAALR